MDLAQRVRDGLSANPSTVAHLRSYYADSGDFFLRKLQELRNARWDTSAEQLERLDKQDIKGSEWLMYLPPEYVQEAFGTSVLELALMSWPYIGEIEDRAFIHLWSSTDRDGELLDTAFTMARKKGRNLRLMQSLYGFLNGTRHAEFADGFVRRTLRETALPTVEPSEKRLSRYEVTPLTTRHGARGYAEGCTGLEGSREEEEYEIYLDGPAGLGLFYKGFPSAVTAFSVPAPDTLLAVQMQTVNSIIYHKDGTRLSRGSNRGIVVLDWKQTLLTLGVHLAEELGMRRFGIQGASNNYWVHEHERSGGELGVPKQRAVEIYDRTAREHGMTLGSDNNYYASVKDLKARLS